MDFAESTVSKGTVVIVKGQSQYNVLRLACDKMAKGFEENGYQVKVLDTLKYEVPAELMLEIVGNMEEGALFIFSFNALYHDMIYANRVSVYDRLNYKVLTLLMDHPYHHKERLEVCHGDNIYIGCVDMDHVDYIKEYNPYIKNAGFLPHFSFQAEEYIPYDDRKIDIYFSGSYTNPDVYKNNFAQLPKVFNEIALAIFEKMLNDSNVILEKALLEHFASMGFECSREEFVEFLNLIYFIDLLLRDYHREKIIRALLEAGIEITVCGKGWAEIDCPHKDRLHILGTSGMDVEENIKLTAESKIVFNIFPNFKNGTHDRVFTAMRNGCLCLTDSNGYMSENFENYENVVYYDINRIDLLPGIIKDLLENPEKAKRIAQNGYGKACSEYDEKSTTKRLLSFINIE